MTELPDLKQLTDEAKDALIRALWEELQALLILGMNRRLKACNPDRNRAKSSHCSAMPKQLYGSILAHSFFYVLP